MPICRYLGNACIEIISEADHIIIDPVFLTPPKHGIDKIFITHHHSDHISLDKLIELRTYSSKKNAALQIYGPKCVQDEFDIDLKIIKPGSKIFLNNGKVNVIENNCWKAEGCVAYLITTGEKKLIHTADSANFSDQLRNINDKIEICFVACFESNFDDYLNFLKIISPNITIPYHFTKEKESEAKKLTDFLNKNNIQSQFIAIGMEFEF